MAYFPSLQFGQTRSLPLEVTNKYWLLGLGSITILTDHAIDVGVAIFKAVMIIKVLFIDL